MRAPQTCDPMLPARLFDKFVNTPRDYIVTNDVYSIRLDYGVISDIPDIPKPRRGRFGKNGEIAILVNAFEMSETAGGRRFFEFHQKVKDEDGRLVDEFASAKVIYFNPDVDEGQPLNLANLPILGPMKYEGRPVGIQILIIELDRMSDATRAMLKSLADLGKTYVETSNPATGALLKIGQSLLDGASRDSVIFEYRALYDNGAHLGGQTVNALQSGRMVFRRAQDRKNDFVWRNLVLDQNTGALFSVGSDAVQQVEANTTKAKPNINTDNGDEADEPFPRATYRAYRSETYLTLNVINHGPDGPLGVYEHKTWDEVSTAFDAYVNKQDLQAAKESVDELVSARRSLNASLTLGGMIDEIVERWSGFGRSLVKAPTAEQSEEDLARSLPDYNQYGERCINSYKKMRSAEPGSRNFRAQARTSTDEFLDVLRTETAEIDGGGPGMRKEEFDLTVRRLWRATVDKLSVSIADQADNEGKFVSGTEFAAAFLGASQKQALPDLLNQLSKKLEATTCEVVVERRP